MESSDDYPYLALDSMLEVSLVEGDTTSVPNGLNQLPSACNETNINVEELTCNATIICGCKKKCLESLGNDIISKANLEFVTCKTEAAKNSYLKNLIQMPVEFAFTDTTKYTFTKLQKSHYYVEANGEKYAICRRAFLSIYNISPHRLRKLCSEVAEENGNCYNKPKHLPTDLSKMPQWNMDEDEEIFYEDLFEDLSQIRNLRLHCTKCDVHLGCYEESKLYKHLHLGVLLCQECFNFYSSGNFPVGEDGSEIYCRWCGEGGTVICCSNCPNVFCKKCIGHNFSKNVMCEIVASSEWLCFLCNFRSLWEHRAVCRAAITYAASATEIKLELANISPKPGDDAKYCCSKDMDQSRPKLLRSSMPSNVTFAKFLNFEQRKARQKEKIPAASISAVTSTSANITTSECTSSNHIEDTTKVTKKSYPKQNLTLGIPFPIRVTRENQKFLKPGNIYQIQSSNINYLSQFPVGNPSLITNPSINNTTNSVLNTTSMAPFIRHPLGKAQYAIISNSKPLYALQNQVPLQTFVNTSPHQTLHVPVPCQTIQNPVPLQTIYNTPSQNLINAGPLQTMQNPVPLQTLYNSPPQNLINAGPLQTLKNDVPCQIFQNGNTNLHSVIQQSMAANASNSVIPVILKEIQNPSKNHILPPLNDDDCQIISTTALNNDCSTNLSRLPTDSMESSSCNINRNNNDYISRIRVRTPAMLQSIAIGDSKTNKFSSSEHSEASNNLFTSPDANSQLLRAVLSDHMYVRTERNTHNSCLYNDTQRPLQFNIEQNNAEIMNNQIDSSTDSLGDAGMSNTFDTSINPSSNSIPEFNSPQFKSCLPEIANLARCMLSRALLLQEEINRMAYVDKSEFYFKNVPLFLEKCKAGITKIEVNYIREKNKQLNNSGEPKEILLVHDNDVVSIQPLIAEETSRPFCVSDNSVKNVNGNNSVKNVDENNSVKNDDENSSLKNDDENSSVKNLDENSSVKNLDENSSVKNLDENNSVKNVDENEVNIKSSERIIKVTSSSTEANQSKHLKRKLCNSDSLINSKKQKVNNISDVSVVLERLPDAYFKKSGNVKMKKEEEDKSKLTNNEAKKCVSKHNCIRPCYVRLVRVNEGVE